MMKNRIPKDKIKVQFSVFYIFIPPIFLTMKIIIITILLAITIRMQAQNEEIPHFRIYNVSVSGAFVYLPQPPEWDIKYSEDSSTVYTTETLFNKIHYDCIIVKLKDSLPDTPQEYENLLLSYLDYLFTQFKLNSTIDPGFGHTLESNTKARGILQYAINAEGQPYIIKGWADNHFLAVMLIIYPNEESANNSNINVQNLFLNGFRFPEKP